MKRVLPVVGVQHMNGMDEFFRRQVEAHLIFFEDLSRRKLFEGEFSLVAISVLPHFDGIRPDLLLESVRVFTVGWNRRGLRDRMKLHACRRGMLLLAAGLTAFHLAAVILQRNLLFD